MPAASFAQAVHLTTFCTPKCDRTLYRRVKRTKPRRIVELGIGDASRAARLLHLAARYHPGTTIEYTGIDLFETRPLGKSLSVKQAYHRLSRTGASVRLVPGDAGPALIRTANALTEMDLVVIDLGDDDLAKVWFYLPRMLHDKTTIARYELRGQQKNLVWLKPRDVCCHARRAA